MNGVAWPSEPEPGDAVRLKHGGPTMTLASRAGPRAEVAYWRDGDLHVVAVPFAALEVVDHGR